MSNFQYYQTPDGQLFLAEAAPLNFGADFAIGDDLDPIFAGDYAIGEDELDEDDEDDEDDFDLAGDMMIGGGRLSKKASKLQKLKMAALARAAGGFRMRTKTAIDKAYELALPFRESVAAGDTATITLQPQRSFQVTGLILGATDLENFLINSINVGQDSQLIASGSMPAEIFSSLSAQSLKLRGSTANPGTTITLSVTNTGAAAHTIGGMFKGPTVLRSA